MTTNQYTLCTRAIAALMGSILLLVPAVARAQSYTIAPIPFLYVWNTAGAIVPNGCVWTYAAGTTTPIATYADTSGTPNANPIIADSFGRFVVYLLPGTNYKFQYEATPCSSGGHGATIKTQDNVQGVPAGSANVDIVGTAGESIAAGQCVYLSDGSGAKATGQWYRCDSANTYSSTLPAVGVAPNAIASVSSGTIRISGYVTGLSSLTVGSAYYVSGTAGSITASAPANRRFLGVADTTTSLVLAPDPPLMTALASGTASASTFLRGDQTWSPQWVVVTSTSTGTLNDFAPGISAGNTVIRMNNASAATISGFTATNVQDGQRALFVSIGAGQVDFVHQSSSSSAANRLINVATTGTTSLAPGSGSAEFVYDITTARWRLVAHDQGAWIGYTPTYSANGAMTYTTVTTTLARYHLRGRVLTVAWDVSGTVGGTPNTQLAFTLPSTFTAGATAFSVYNANLAAAAAMQTTSGVTTFVFYKDITASGNWTAATQRLLGSWSIEVN